MSVLIIGGSSQDAFYLIKEYASRKVKIFCTFRSEESANSRITDLRQSFVDLTCFVPILDFKVDSNSISKFIRHNSITHLYYLSAVNLPGSVFVTEELKKQMNSVHIQNPSEVLEAVISSDSTFAIFPLSSKMYTKSLNGDRLIKLNEPANPQNYYGETKAIFWDILKSSRSSNNYKFSAPILFNHESRMRAPQKDMGEFAIRKLTRLLETNSAVETVINCGITFYSREDWLHASDVSKVMLKIADSRMSVDYIVSSGRARSILDLLIDYYVECKDYSSASTALSLLNNHEEMFTCLIGDNSITSKLVGKIETVGVLQ